MDVALSGVPAHIDTDKPPAHCAQGTNECHLPVPPHGTRLTRTASKGWLSTTCWTLVLQCQVAHPLQVGLGAGVTLFLSDVETNPWKDPLPEQVAGMTDSFLITKGGDGALEYTSFGQSSWHVPAVPVSPVVDTNGAGDTFATAYMLASALGSPDPGSEASHAASRTVQLEQKCKPACVTSGLRGVVSAPEWPAYAPQGRVGYWLGQMKGHLYGLWESAGEWLVRAEGAVGHWWRTVLDAVDSCRLFVLGLD